MTATPTTGTRERVFRRSFPPEPSSARLLRAVLRRYLAAIDVEARHAEQLLLCADEALINAVVHAPRSPVLVAAWVRDDRLVLEVSDEGPGFDAAQVAHAELPDLDADHGRGLFLIHRLMERVRIDSDENGTTVRMELQLPAAESSLVGISSHESSHWAVEMFKGAYGERYQDVAVGSEAVF